MFRLILVFSLFFLSGVAGLIYEVLWMKQLGLLFGNTAQSVAASTAAFFLGIAAGSFAWGEKLRTIRRPLLTYALLEIGIVAAAMLFFLIFTIWEQVFPVVFGLLGDWPVALTLSKLVLAIALIFPATFLMGGTLPVMGQYLVREASQLGQWSGSLYFVNTLGAAAGAMLAGFFLIYWLGFRHSYYLAMGVSAGVAVIAYWLSRNESAISEPPADTKSQSSSKFASRLILVAFVSGFASLGLQVLWTRMFAQVLQNSVYSYAAILAVFLLALSLGALFARFLSRYDLNRDLTLTTLLCLSALSVLLVPFGFMAWTDGMTYIGDSAGLRGYLLQVLVSVIVLVGIPTTIMGTLLPYLYKHAEDMSLRPGVIIGRLNSWNTGGAVVGSLVAGFVVLELIGLWNGIRLMGLIYLITAIALCLHATTEMSLRVKYLPLALVIVSVTLLDPAGLPKVRIQPIEKDEALLEVLEGSGGTVAVVKRDGGLRVKLNNWYTLGGSGAARMEEMQSHLALQLHPAPSSVFYLGLGSGITAGTAMQYPVERVVVAELVDDVIAASKKYFAPYVNRLFDDPRVQIVNADGRNYLRTTRETFDLIIADLFIPWRSGVGYLYSLEHFSAAKTRLNDRGLFVQWIPLYQVSDVELGIIGKTMLQVFPKVSLWRGDFYSDKPMMALVGHIDDSPLGKDNHLVRSSMRVLQEHKTAASEQVPLIAHYLGTLEESQPLLKDRPVNTDNLPWIEYLAPASHRAERAGEISWFVGDSMLNFMRTMLIANEPTSDPFLSRQSSEMQYAVYAGLYFHQAAIAREQGKEAIAEEAMSAAKELLAR